MTAVCITVTALCDSRLEAVGFCLTLPLALIAEVRSNLARPAQSPINRPLLQWSESGKLAAHGLPLGSGEDPLMLGPIFTAGAFQGRQRGRHVISRHGGTLSLGFETRHFKTKELSELASRGVMKCG